MPPLRTANEYRARMQSIDFPGGAPAPAQSPSAQERRGGPGAPSLGEEARAAGVGPEPQAKAPSQRRESRSAVGGGLSEGRVKRPSKRLLRKKRIKKLLLKRKPRKSDFQGKGAKRRVHPEPAGRGGAAEGEVAGGAEQPRVFRVSAEPPEQKAEGGLTSCCWAARGASTSPFGWRSSTACSSARG